MGTIPSVSPGQLIDIATLGTMIDLLNNYEAERASVSNTSTVSGATVKTPNLVFQAKTATITGQPGATGAQTQQITFDSRFNSTPIVTVTPMTVKNSTKATEVAVGIDAVDSGSVTVIVDFKNATTKTINLHIIAIGTPIS